MSEQQSYTIDNVGWHTRTPGNPESRERTHTRFASVIAFLQQNGLTNRTLLQEGQVIDDTTSLHTDDLTDLGRVVMKNAITSG